MATFRCLKSPNGKRPASRRAIEHVVSNGRAFETIQNTHIMIKNGRMDSKLTPNESQDFKGQFLKKLKETTFDFHRKLENSRCA